MKTSKDEIIYKLKSNIFFIILILGAVFNDLVLRALTIKKIFYWKPLFTTVGVILLVSIFVWFFSYKNRKYIFIALSAIFSLISSLNYIYYGYYSSFLSFSLIGQLRNIGEVKSSVLKNLDFKMLIFFIPTIVMIFTLKKLLTKEFFKKLSSINPIKRKTEFILPLCTGLLLLLVVFSTLSVADKSRIVKQWNRPYLVEHLGIYSFTTADIVKNISSNKVYKMESEEIVSLMENLKNKNENAIKENKYTNILKGKDLYVIHYESAQTFPMELEFGHGPVTPFLNELASESLYFENFYPQHSVGTSSDSEFSFSTSLLPINNGTVFITHTDRKYITIQNLLRDKGYHTFSMHGNNGDLWNRDIMHYELGYERFYNKNDYNIDEEIGLGLSDISFYSQSVDKIKEIKKNDPRPIMATLITLSNHYPFSDTHVYGDFDVGFLEGTDLGNYLKSYNYADQALKSFFGKMDREGLLDNAAIIIYGDHEAKIPIEDYNLLYNPGENNLNEDDLEPYEISHSFAKKLQRTPFIIWTKDGILNDNIKTPMGMIDVMPTLGNMLDIYNPYSLGKDIFSIEENTVIFPDASWLNENYYYSASSSDLYDLRNVNGDEIIEEPEEAYNLEKNLHIKEKVEISNKIIQNDLIKLYNDSLLENLNRVLGHRIEKY